MRVSACLGLLALGCSPTADLVSARESSLGAESALAIGVVYAGGGNTGASFDRDFVVVVNRSEHAASTAGLSLQYASATGTSALGATDAARTLLPSLELAAGQALLVEGASGANGAPLGETDVVDSTPLPLATSGGRLALVVGTESLACNGGSSPCADEARARIVDLVGWGAASFAEGSPARAPTNESALVRALDGCTDTGDNAADFVVATAVPRRLADAARACTIGDAGVPIDASSEVPDGASTGPFASTTTLERIQGNAHRSPLEGAVVEHVFGVVSSVAGRRLSVESLPGDGAASGLFVEAPTDPAPAIGSIVELAGTVRERRPDCSACAETSSAFANFSVTTLEASRLAVRGTAPLAEPVLLGERGETVPEPHDARGAPADREREPALDPAQALDFLERFEGRRARLVAPRTASPTRSIGAAGREVVVILDEARVERDARGDVAAPAPGMLGQRLVLVDGPGAALPDLDLGDRFGGEVVGVVDYARGRPVLRVTRWSTATRYRVATEAVPADGEALSVASYNVHNLSATSAASRFASLARIVVDGLGSPAVLALQEVQDDDGATNGGETSAARTLGRIVDAIVAAGGPSYDAVDVAPIDGEDGGQPGGNIRPALLVRREGPFRVVRRGTVDARIPARAVRISGSPALEVSPARLGANDTAFVDGRKPLVVELEGAGAPLFVIVVHLRSRIGDAPRLGRFLPPARPSETVRSAEASVVGAFADSLIGLDDDVALVVLGDFNDESHSPALAPLFRAGLVDALAAVPPVRRATYVFDGVGEGIDGLLVTSGLAARLARADVVHVDAARALGDSDHDPVHASFHDASDSRHPRSCAVDVRPSGSPDLVALGFVALAFALGARRVAARARRSIRRGPRRCP